MTAFLRELRERLRWAPHNLVAHPLMIFLPSPWDVRLHDVTIPQGRLADAYKEPAP